jgi:hypothetical protein
MLIIREHFIAKPGQAGKLVAMLKEVMAIAAPGKARVITDVTGEFNRVIMETEAETLADLEARLKEYASNPAWKSKMVGYTDLWTSGGREILRVM